MQEDSLGQELIKALGEVTQDTSKLRRVRPNFDIATIRRNLHLSQKQFSTRFHISIETLKNWEQGKRTQDASTIAYLTCIAKAPDVIDRLLNH